MWFDHLVNMNNILRSYKIGTYFFTYKKVCSWLSPHVLWLLTFAYFENVGYLMYSKASMVVY